MTATLPAPEPAKLHDRAELRELRLLVDSLCELIGAGAPLDGMSRSRALGLVIGLERLLPTGQAGMLLARLRHTVQRDRQVVDDNAASKELCALMEQLQQQREYWLSILCGSPGSAVAPA